MTTAQKNTIKQQQIEQFKHQKAKDIPNRKLKIMATDIFRDTVKELRENDFAILNTPPIVRVFSNEGLMFEGLRLNADCYTVLYDDSYFDGTVK